MSRGFVCLGLMSGTSMDGIDAVLAKITPAGDTTLAHVSFPYSKSLRDELFRAVAKPLLSLENFGALDARIGGAFAAAAVKCIRTARAKKIRADVDVIGSHGQTVFHNPQRLVSLQLGSPQVIANATGVTTVSNFRMADIVAGGEGAPFLPFYHRRIVGARAGVAVHNLGGISNFTYFGTNGKLVALDTGPASCLMDAAISALSHGRQTFDRGGAWASAGRVSEKLLNFLKRERAVAAYIARPAPKSTGRELFTFELAERVLREAKQLRLAREDVLATLGQFSVDLMVVAYERFVLRRGLPLKEVVFCGGGARNPFLLGRFQDSMPTVKVRVLEDYGVASQAIEAQAFGCYGIMAIAGQAQNVPAATGARAEVVCGEITPGRNWSRLYQKVHSASHKNVSILL